MPPTLYANERTWFDTGDYLGSDHVVVHVSTEGKDPDIDAYMKIVAGDSQVTILPPLWAGNAPEKIKQEERALNNARILENAVRVYREALEAAISVRRNT